VTVHTLVYEDLFDALGSLCDDSLSPIVKEC